MKRYSYDRTKTASWDGPFLWWDDRYLTVWTLLNSYGRVHHVRQDLDQAEKILGKIHFKYLDAIRDAGVKYSPSEITVDGVPGGRNTMIMSFHFGGDGEQLQKAINDNSSRLPFGIRDVKEPPRH